MNSVFEKLTRESLIKFLIRLGPSFVFIWFGVDKFFHPLAWLGWVPQWALPLLPVSGEVAMYALGAVETALGLLVLFGIWLFWSSLVTAAMLLAIIVTVPFTEVTVRDLGIFLNVIAIVLLTKFKETSAKI